MNVVYKILAKVLAIRIEKILPNIINSTHTGFVKGRYILENLITCWEAMNWAKASSQDCAMLLIDYEKAYDRIEWGFIMMMLEALGVPTHYYRMVSILLFGAKAAVEINGVRSEFFSLTRSIRQGCPLAPSLFVIASDSLHYLLNYSSLSIC